MPMDESTVRREDAGASGTIGGEPDDMKDIWSSIGPGRPASIPVGPPTIRPTDDPGRIETRNSTRMSSPTPSNSSTDTGTDHSTGDAIRDELRIGVRMLEALELQLKRSETLIAAQQDATRRAEIASERLEANLDRAASASGPLSVDSNESIVSSDDEQARNAASATIELRQVVEHAGTLRREFHGDLSAVSKATIALVEAVELATSTERDLRNAIADATGAKPGVGSGIGAAAESIGEVLRRLAREFDAAADSDRTLPERTPFDATPPETIGSIDPHERRRVGTLEITRAVEFDASDSPSRSTPDPGPAVH